MQTCPACQSPLDGLALSCPKCGISLHPEAVYQSPDSARQSSLGSIIMWTVGVGFVGFLFLSCAGLFMGFRSVATPHMTMPVSASISATVKASSLPEIEAPEGSDLVPASSVATPGTAATGESTVPTSNAP